MKFSLLRLLPLLVLPFTAAAATYYVDPVNGNDTNNGSLATPFKTLGKARDTVRPLTAGMTGNHKIYLRGGTYYLPATFTLASGDSGTNGYNVIYQAYLYERPVISGGRLVTGWSLYDSGKNIYRASVGTSVEFRQLYVNGVRAVRARSENGSGWTVSGDGYTCPSSVAAWGNLSYVEVVHVWEWKMFRGAIASASGTHATMKTPYWTTAKLPDNGRGYSPQVTPEWIENAYELLDEEGEWYLNRATGYLYYKPRAGENMTVAEVIRPSLQTLVNSAGASNIQFNGITFSHAGWLFPNTTEGFCTNQADTYIKAAAPGYGFIPGAVEFSLAKNFRFENNCFEHLGAAGLKFDKGCQGNVVFNNVFRDISASGVYVGDGGKGHPEGDANLIKDNTIEGNLIHQCAAEYYGSVGIFVMSTKHSVILRNDLFDLPYTGISIHWTWAQATPYNTDEQLRYNRIANIGKSINDFGGIYTAGQSANSDISYNHLFDLNARFAGPLYSDQGTSGYTLESNVTENIPNEGLFYFANSAGSGVLVNNTWTTNPYWDANGTTPTVSNSHLYTLGTRPSGAQTIVSGAGRFGKTWPFLNLTAGRPVTSSSTAGAGFEAAKGNDGNYGARWASASESNPWWQVDLGQPQQIGSIELVTRQDSSVVGSRTNFEIRASNISNFATYTVLGKRTGNDLPLYSTWTQRVSDPNTFRYLRVQRINNAGSFSVAELRAFRGTNRALNGRVTASSSLEDSTWGKQKATDGKTTDDGAGSSSGWSSNNSLTVNHNEWVQVDMGAPFLISQVALYARRAGVNSGYGFPIDYTVEISSNGSTWTTVATRTGEARSNAARFFAFPPVFARYMRVVGTNLRSNPNDSNYYRMQFPEMEVY